MIGVIIPAHNEADLLQRCLSSVALAAAHSGLQGETVQVAVALDACSDQTAAICTRHGAATVALNARCVGAARALAASHVLGNGARWIASTDADTVVPPDWLYAQLQCGADAFCGVVEVVDWLDYAPTVREAFSMREHARDGHKHVHGANLGVSARAYLDAGGFSSLCTGEDVAFVRSLRESGASIARLAKPAVSTSARRRARAPSGFSGFLLALEREMLDASDCLLPPQVQRQ